MRAGLGRSVLPLALVVVRGRSMEPTLHDGDRLLVRRGGHTAKPGAVAVVRLPGDRPLSIKRIAFRDPESGGWWVERDNPLEGVDSWLVGAVPSENVLGVAVLKLFPVPGRIPPRTTP